MVGQPRGAVEGRLKMDEKDLEAAGFTTVELECFLKLLFEELKTCTTGPAEQEEMTSRFYAMTRPQPSAAEASNAAQQRPHPSHHTIRPAGDRDR